jgi:hypothetical protein
MSVESFKTDQDLNNTDTVTIEGAFARPVTELWTFNFAAGVLRSEFEFLGNNQQQSRAPPPTTRCGWDSENARNARESTWI